MTTKIKAISQLDVFNVTDESTSEIFYGCNQDWFAEPGQRSSGCAPTVACNLLIYLEALRFKNAACKFKTEAVHLMEEAWNFVTPAEKGIPTTQMFVDAVQVYGKAKNFRLTFETCEVPQDKETRPSFCDVLAFLESAFVKDLPVAFLNLCSGEETALETWHWVTAIGIEKENCSERALLRILDNGMIKTADLALWLDTTRQGGGFAYFEPS